MDATIERIGKQQFIPVNVTIKCTEPVHLAELWHRLNMTMGNIESAYTMDSRVPRLGASTVDAWREVNREVETQEVKLWK